MAIRVNNNIESVEVATLPETWKWWSRVKFLLLTVLFLPFSLSYASGVCTPNGGNGEKSDVSCAESRISFLIPALARVTLPNAFDLGEFDFENQPKATDDFCIWYNTEQFSLTVKSSNSNGNNRFRMVGGNSSESIDYNIIWFDKTGNQGGYLDLSKKEGVAQDNLFLPERPADATCNIDNVSFEVSVPLANLNNKPMDSYSDTVTVEVSVQ